MNNIKNFDYQKYISYLVIAYAFVLPLSRAAIVLISVLLLIVWLMEGEYKKKYILIKNSKVILALGAFFVLNFLSLLWSDDIALSLGYIKKYWYFLPLLVFATSIQKKYLYKILSAFIFGMFVSEVISYGVFFGLWEFKHASIANPSPFMHHIEYSIFLAFTALLLLSRILHTEQIKYKAVYSFFFLTISGNLFLTAGRTGQAAFILGLFVLVLSNVQNKLRALSLSAALATLILGSAFILSTTFHNRIIAAKNNLVELIQKENYCTSWGSRVGAWILSRDIIAEHFTIGAGTVDNMKIFHYLIDNKYPAMKCMQKSFMHIHNQYLQIFTSLGIVGLLLFLAIFYYLAKTRLKNREYRDIKYIYLTIILFAFIPEVMLHRQFSMALFALVVGLILAQKRFENEV